jgi:hypothetical protein
MIIKLLKYENYKLKYQANESMQLNEQLLFRYLNLYH